jgi:Fe-S cluster biosynthesis and repair protein YggX
MFNVFFTVLFYIAIMMFVSITMSEETKPRYLLSVLKESQEKTVVSLCQFFPETKEDKLNDYNPQKTYFENIKHIRTNTDNIIQILYEARLELATYINIQPSNCDDYVKIRSALSKYYLDVLRYINLGIDPKHDYNREIYLNIGYKGYMPGISPEAIENPVDRKEYEKILWDNDVLANERRIQTYLMDIKTIIPELLNKYLIASYSRTPRADNELVELLEKYKYPAAEKAKIFKALNIPYKGFREWRTNDGLLTLTAKLISADKNEVKLEKEDGKKFTIEIAYLRKEDQDYVKKQREPKPKTSP